MEFINSNYLLPFQGEEDDIYSNLYTKGNYLVTKG